MEGFARGAHGRCQVLRKTFKVYGMQGLEFRDLNPKAINSWIICIFELYTYICVGTRLLMCSEQDPT